MSWAEHAACRDQDVWQHETLPRRQAAAWRRKAVARWCDQCPVRAACRDDITDVPELHRYGLWDGQWWGVTDTTDTDRLAS